MHEGQTVFAQLMDWLPKYELTKCIKCQRAVKTSHDWALENQPL